MLSFERKYAKLVRSYQSLLDRYEKSLARERALREDVKELRAELREERRERRAYEKASANTMRNLVASLHSASGWLAAVGDFEHSQKLDDWREILEETMQPVANVQNLVALLEQWVEVVPLDDDDALAVLYLKTQHELRQLTGTD